MRREPHIPLVQHWNRIDLIPPLRIDSSGRHGPTQFEVRRDGWRRTSQGYYVPASVDGSRVEQRIIEAAANLGRYGGVTGWAGMRWMGSRWCNGVAADGTLLPVTLAADNMRRPSNAVLSEERLNPAELIVVDGLRITSAIRSVTFEMRYSAGVRRAVVWFDMAAYDDLVSLEEVLTYVGAYLNGWTGVILLRAALLLVVENSWSPQETLLRLVWIIDAGLPTPLCNHPVFDLDGRHLGTPDLLDVEAGLIVQYDGPDHLSPEQAAFDQFQDARYHEHGLRVVRVDRDDMADYLRLAARLSGARTEALTHTRTREWTTDLPDWWVSTATVDERRALTTEQADRWLKYRHTA